MMITSVECGVGVVSFVAMHSYCQPNIWLVFSFVLMSSVCINDSYYCLRLID